MSETESYAVQSTNEIEYPNESISIPRRPLERPCSSSPALPSTSFPDHSAQDMDELVELVSLIDICEAQFQVHGGENRERQEPEKVAKG
jgi:hypothetical protein